MFELRRYAIAAYACFGVFLLLILAIVSELNRSLDPAILSAIQRIDVPIVLLVAKVIGIVGSLELTTLTAGIVAVVLWSRGYGLAALAPLCFAATTPVEFLAKFFVPQMPVHPDVFRSPFPYPLLSFLAPHPFPSGHAARLAFWLAFGVPLLLSTKRLGCAAALALYGSMGLFGRLILGEHWPSDVLGGVMLGASFGLLAGNAIRASEPAVRPLGFQALVAAVFGQSAKF